MTTGVRTIAMADEREAEYLRVLTEHGPSIRRLAASYERDPSRREDLVQDVCLALWQAWPRFRGDSSERTFVFRIAHNRAVSHVLRWRRRATDALDDREAFVEPGLDPERSASARQRQERLQQAVRALPLGLRQVITLTLEGLSQREIGEVLGISESNVAVRATRARQALGRLLDARGVRT